MAFTIMKNVAKRALDFINNANIVSIRVWVTMGCVIVTTLSYVIVVPYTGKSWEPSWEWLLFLLALAGVDISAYAIKRWTHVTSDGEAVGQKIKKSNNPVPEQNNVPNTPSSSEEEILKDDDEGLATTDISEIKENEKG